MQGQSAGIPEPQALADHRTDKELENCSFKPAINKKSAEMAEEKKRKKNQNYLLAN